jgi:Holliday junction resolvase RusA-like endonuclease
MTTFLLDPPPSANHLFRNVKGGRAKTNRYHRWIDGQLKSLIAQRARAIETPVAIRIAVPRHSRSDLDNKVKPAIDLLVKAGIIPDDGPKFVRSVTVTFAEGEQMTVDVTTCAAVP